MAKRKKQTAISVQPEPDYGVLISGISDLLDQARRMSARAVNSILTATYWEIGQRIVEYEQGGKARAGYGETLLKRLSQDLTATHGRGFSRANLQQMRLFFLGWEICQTPSGAFDARMRRRLEDGDPSRQICQTVSVALSPDGGAGLSGLETGKRQAPSAESPLALVVRWPCEAPSTVYPGVFPLAWSHYVRLMSVANLHARAFYEAEDIRGGWSVRQLNRQINTQFYERTSHSKRQAAMLAKGQKPLPEDAVSVEDELRDPYLLEFLNLKDEYSESGQEILKTQRALATRLAARIEHDQA